MISNFLLFFKRFNLISNNCPKLDVFILLLFRPIYKQLKKTIIVLAHVIKVYNVILKVNDTKIYQLSCCAS